MIENGTLVNSGPSFTRGTAAKGRAGFMIKVPCCNEYKLLWTISKSPVPLTGKKRLRGTLMPFELLKNSMAAPAARSSWTIGLPFKVYFMEHNNV